MGYTCLKICIISRNPFALSPKIKMLLPFFGYLYMSSQCYSHIVFFLQKSKTTFIKPVCIEQFLQGKFTRTVSLKKIEVKYMAKLCIRFFSSVNLLLWNTKSIYKSTVFWVKIIFATKSLIIGNIIRTFISNHKIILPQVNWKDTGSVLPPVRKIHKKCMTQL